MPEWEQWLARRAAHDGRVDSLRALTHVAQRCMRWTPRVHIEQCDGPPALVLDLTGCLPTHGGAARTVRRVQRAFARWHINAHMGLAATAGAALALSGALALGGGALALGDSRAAAAGALAIAPPTHPWPALDPLPLIALRMPPGTLQGLLEVNVTTIGHLRAIGRHAVADRYGPIPAQRLDMLDGRQAWPFHPVASPQRIAGEFVFATPCAQLEAVQHATRHAIAQLCAELDRRVRGVSTLEVRVQRAHMRPVRGRLYFGAPTRNAAHLWALLAPRIERMPLGCHEHGMGIERIQLVALRLGSARCDATRQAVGQLVDHLCARLGSGTVHEAIELAETATSGALTSGALTSACATGTP